MIAKAKLKYSRISPRKARSVVNLVRGKNVNEALDILINLNKKASGIVEKLLKSAMSNAKQQSDEDGSSLYISKIKVDEGPFLKRYRARAFGRAAMIRRRLSHIEIELDMKKSKKQKSKKIEKKKIEKKKISTRKTKSKSRRSEVKSSKKRSAK
jgi:large subunit ribosomal protein L22